MYDFVEITFSRVRNSKTKMRHSTHTPLLQVSENRHQLTTYLSFYYAKSLPFDVNTTSWK